jgi:uncharacterized protein YhaN
MAGSLRFDLVRVARMPGFQHTGFQLADLSPGINIVFGPNGSGKTTSAHAIEALLWPRRAADLRASLSGRFSIGGDRWAVEVDYDRAVHQRDGITTDPPVLPPAEECDRYRLSLHELISADNARFASAILREAAGGYDLDAARQALPSASPNSARSREARALRAAVAELDAAVAKQRELHEQERDLVLLRQRLAGATAAQDRAELLSAAIAYASARDTWARARADVEAFHSSLAEMHGDEAERLQTIEEELRAIEAETARWRSALAAAERAIAEAALDDDAVDAALIGGLTTDLESLRQQEQKLEDCRRAVADAVRRVEDARGQITGAVDEARLPEIGMVALGEIAELADRYASARQRVQILTSRIELLDRESGIAGASASDSSLIAAGEAALRTWLRAAPRPGGRERLARLAALAAAAVLIGTGLVTAPTNPLGWLLAIFGAGVLLLALSDLGVGSEDPRRGAREEYERTGIKPPEAWDTESVTQRLEDLQRRKAEADLAMERKSARLPLSLDLSRAEEELAGLETERVALSIRLGVPAQADPARLIWLAQRIAVWQAAHGELAGAEESMRRAAEHAESTRDSLLGRLAPYAGDPLDSAGSLHAAILRLDQRRQTRDEAVRTRSQAEEQIRVLGERTRKCRDSAAALYRKCGVSEGDVRALHQRCQEHPMYRAAAKTADDAEIALRHARGRMDALKAESRLLEADAADLQRERDEAVERAARLREISEQITRIETRVEDAKIHRGVEECLERVERCREELRQARERETSGVIAELLTKSVRAATEAEHLPAVFHRAREVFGRITHGRYDLSFAGVPEPEFRAYDNRERRGLKLDELSSGTRVQLLLAVRVAFVEKQEGEARLPLVLDEVLGNSDDDRAAAVMDAVLELAREGRQIFYMTAQHDEVLKWRALLEPQRAVEWRVVDLVESRKSQRPLQIDHLQLAITPTSRVPHPGSASHGDYARMLRVPGFDPLHADAGNLHLWYLVDEPRRLHALLSAGVEHWGELEALARHADGAIVAPDELARLAALARAADAWFDGVRIGSGRPVDREVLVRARGVTSSFLDRVDDLSRRLGGDAKRLIAAIEEGEVKGFRTTQMAAFREFLEEEGYIDAHEPLADVEIRGRTLGSIAPELEQSVVTIADADALIARLQAGAATGVVAGSA